MKVTKLLVVISELVCPLVISCLGGDEILLETLS